MDQAFCGKTAAILGQCLGCLGRKALYQVAQRMINWHFWPKAKTESYFLNKILLKICRINMGASVYLFIL